MHSGKSNLFIFNTSEVNHAGSKNCLMHNYHSICHMDLHQRPDMHSFISNFSIWWRSSFLRVFHNFYGSHKFETIFGYWHIFFSFQIYKWSATISKIPESFAYFFQKYIGTFYIKYFNDVKFIIYYSTKFCYKKPRALNSKVQISRKSLIFSQILSYFF